MPTCLKTKFPPSCVGLYEALGMFPSGFGQNVSGPEHEAQDQWEGREMSLGACRELGAIDQVQTLASQGCKVPAWLGSKHSSKDPWKLNSSTSAAPICDHVSPPIHRLSQMLPLWWPPCLWVVHAWPVNSSPHHSATSPNCHTSAMSLA